jgi:hypothetical protein
MLGDAPPGVTSDNPAYVGVAEKVRAQLIVGGGAT